MNDATKHRIAVALTEIADALNDDIASGGAAEAIPPPSAVPAAQRFAQASQATAPTGVCPTHNEPWRHVPAGVSKRTGKPYNEFWSCPVRDCNERPQ